MNLDSQRSAWSVRVYIIALVSILTATLVAAAPIRVTIEPAMTKGSASAPVTIIEFSDYQ